MNTKRLLLALLLIAVVSVICLEAFDIPGGCYPTWHVTLAGYANKLRHKHYITRTLDVNAPADQVSWIALRMAHSRWPRRHWVIISIVPAP